jgi:GH15 family glucan-1,4-alpha-glucosidase
VLLAAWLGWGYVQAGDRERAMDLLRWVEAQAGAQGHLPEQVAEHALAPGYVAEREGRWGAIARPLLWSHAMYLILRHASMA